PGLPDIAPAPALYRVQRLAQDREPEEGVRGKLPRQASASPRRRGKNQLSDRAIWGISMSGTTKQAASRERVEKSEAQWRAELTPMQYAVLREKATERPFSGEYDHTNEPGTYVCAGCGQTLFES